MAQIRLTTTGTPATVVINDLGGITFTHSVVNYILFDTDAPELSPFTIEQIRDSNDLQDAIDGSEVTLTDEFNNPVTKVSEASGGALKKFSGTTTTVDSGNGVVPDDGVAASGRFLKDNGTWDTPSSGTDINAKVSSNDTTTGFLEDKIVGVSGKIVITTLNDGLDEDLQINVGADIFDTVTDDTDNITVGATNKFVTSGDLTNLGNLSGTNSGDEVAASESVSGIAELATQTEVNSGTDTLRIVTPDTLEDKTYGTFSGSTITDNITLKTALQELETAVEGAVGTTNLSIGTTTATTVDINSDTGTDATIPAATITVAGLLQATDKVKLNNTSGTNSGDQTSIVGITGTTAQFNTALTDGSFATGGGTATGTNTGDQTSIVGITGTKAQFDTAVTDGDFLYSGDVVSADGSVTTHSDVTDAGSGAIITTAERNKVGFLTVTQAVDLDTIESDTATNNGKVSNVDTDLSFTRNATTVTVVSSDGTNAILPEADTTNAGILGSDKWDEIVANTAKVSNVTTNLSIGTTTATTLDVNSSDGTNATIPQAVATTAAGLLSGADKAKLDGIAKFTSTGQTIVSDSSVTIAHGLGAEPDTIHAYLQCTAADEGYSIGDKVAINSMEGNSAGDRGIAITFDATNVVVAFGDEANVFRILNKTTNRAENLDNSSWDLYVKAIKI